LWPRWPRFSCAPWRFPPRSAERGISPEAQAGFDIRPSHFVERHGGLLIVAFGESVIAVGIGVAAFALDAGVIATAVLGLVLAAALWWAYFAWDAERAEANLIAASLSDRVRMASPGWPTEVQRR